MNILTNIYSYVSLWCVCFAMLQPRIKFLPPSGILFNITDRGYDLVNLQYRINEPVSRTPPGRWNINMEKIGKAWKHIDFFAGVVPGDIVYYSLYARSKYNRTILASDRLINQNFTLPGTDGSVLNSPKSERNSTTSSNNETIKSTTTVSSLTSNTVIPSAQGGNGPVLKTSQSEISSTTVRYSKTTTISGSVGSTAVPSSQVYAVVGGVIAVVLIVCVTAIFLYYIRNRVASSVVVERDRDRNSQQNNINESLRIERFNPGQRNNQQHPKDTKNVHQNAMTITQQHSIVNKHLYDYPNSKELQGQFEKERNKYDYPNSKELQGQFEKQRNKYDYPNSKELQGQFDKERQKHDYPTSKDLQVQSEKERHKYEHLTRDRGQQQTHSNEYDSLLCHHSYLKIIE